MLSGLDASLKFPQFTASFPHALENDMFIHMFLDACHMLKLARNTLGEKGMRIDGNGCRTLWRYIVSLTELRKRGSACRK